MVIKFNGEKYNTYKTAEEIQGLINMGFNPRHVWCVKMEHKETGELRSMDWGHQITGAQAILEATAHFGREYHMLYVQPIMTLIEDRECLERRLQFQLSRRNECSDPVKYSHLYKARRQAPRDTIAKLRLLS